VTRVETDVSKCKNDKMQKKKKKKKQATFSCHYQFSHVGSHFTVDLSDQTKQPTNVSISKLYMSHLGKNSRKANETT
jgi:hypothetical protein